MNVGSEAVFYIGQSWVSPSLHDVFQSQLVQLGSRCYFLVPNFTSFVTDLYANLLSGEQSLESYLRDNPPSEETVEKAKRELAGAETSLRYVINRSPKDKVICNKGAITV